ncbi:ornithine carbamoyltransferase [Haloferax sp. Atlit-12N]|uniref:ornithine carbamoyltransferase n=1 Tax=Haloferax sp. Atlit-12N TaxID=2077203 RepID=UPI000E24A005|nr:ornithine carbamoyltransferase [Haloferax sp. Atlit-12N]RDZ66200.1 ornithine carbamoyltransferase [Haloferax sp. Atlit-12N]
MLETTHFTDIDDISASELDRVLTRAADIKSGDDEAQLTRATLAMLFEKPSTRTRVSFETGMTELGGHALFLGPEDIQLGHGEPLSDTARVLGRYGDAIMVRLFDHEDLLEIAEHSDAPVINGLTDDAHPCQTLADLLTIREHVGDFDEVQAAWVGDGNNVGQSFVLGCAMAGIDLTVATPPEYGVDDDVLEKADELGSTPTITTDPEEAVADADVVYTDVWISMGQEDQRHEKLQAFEGFQLNEDLLSDTDAKVMHCLPAHRGEEITGDVLEGERSLVWDQAENRLHAQKGLIVELLEE